MKLDQVAAQLYTAREFCQTASALADTAKKIRAMGYAAVQVSGVGAIAENEIVAILKGEGLTICSTHEPGLEILDHPDKVITRLSRLGCTLTAFPFPADIDFAQPAQVRTFVRKLDQAGALLRAAGITLGYHNHALEFFPFQDAPALEFIYAETDAKHLAAELDTYWIHQGGGDVVSWCRRLRGRLPSMHLKDWVRQSDNTATYGEIGSGILPFRQIIAEAEASGCRWFIVEQDTCPGSPFDSLRQSHDYIRAHLLS